MKIGLLTAIWGRPRLTEIVLDYYARLGVPGVELVLVATVSPEDPDPPRLDRSWFYAEANNMPLTDKWNAGAELMAAMDVDAVAIAGSDDFLNAAYFEAMADLMASGVDYVKLGALHFYDAVHQRMIYQEDCFSGLGRCLSRRLMERVDWRPYIPGYRRGIDGHMDECCRPHCRDTTRWLKKSRDRGIFAVDVKVGKTTSIHSYRKVTKKYADESIELDPVTELHTHLPSVADQLLSDDIVCDGRRASKGIRDTRARARHPEGEGRLADHQGHASAAAYREVPR